MKRILLISGKQGSGKTTIATAIKRSLSLSCSLHSLKFADPLYEIHDAVWKVLNKYGLELKHKKDGPLLQVIGTEFGRKNLGNDIWVQLCRNKVDKILSEHTVGVPCIVIIDDARFENEFDYFPEAVTVRLECNRDTRKSRAEMWRDNEFHPSEISLDSYTEQGKFQLVLDTGKETIQSCVNQVLARLL